MNKKDQRNDAIYNYLKSCWEDAGEIPTYREIAKDCRMSLATVSEGLSILEMQERITRQPYKSRSIRLVEIEDKQEINEEAEEVYQYLVSHIEAGHIPSQSEIADDLYISRGAVRQALALLEADKRIELGKGQRKIYLI